MKWTEVGRYRHNARQSLFPAVFVLYPTGFWAREAIEWVNKRDNLHSSQAKYNRFASRSKTDESTFSETIETIRNMIKLKNRSTDEDIVMGDTEGHVRELARWERIRNDLIEIHSVKG